MNYEQAMEYIHAVQWAGHKPGLTRTRTLLAALGDPHKKLQFVHVAGTNGKGSTAAMLASCLQAAGYRVGLYTSPFINRFNERIQVNGQQIPDEALVRLIKIRGQIGSISGNNTPLILLDNVEIPSIQMVNPNDVQSISVLKDAASSSIYGSKAAFGVILITTKSGAQTDKFEVSYSNNFSWQDPAKSIEIGGIEALQYTLDAQINRGEPMPAAWSIQR